MTSEHKLLSPEVPGAGDSGGSGGAGGGGLVPASGRRASVNLRQGQGAGGATEIDMLDPANRSLADALSITLRLVYGAMFILIGLYALSGFQSVREGQEGVKLLFGRQTQTGIQPGFHLSAPFPAGELLKIDTGIVSLELDRPYWPDVQDPTKRNDVAALSPVSKLNPGVDGSLITGDANLAHAQFSAQYSRKNPALYAANVLPENEYSIVASAIGRGVVQAVAGVKIDDLLRQGGGENGVVAQKAKRVAQDLLDQLETGIEIQRLQLTQVVPPKTLSESFQGFLRATADAGKKRDEADAQAKRALSAAAGEAVPALVTLIDRYDVATRSKDEAEAAKLLAMIDSILEGKAVEAEGVSVAAGAVSGRVSQIISEAKGYRSEIVNRRRAEAQSFRAKLAQFEANPLVTVHGEWVDAVTAFVGRPTVSYALLPPGTTTLTLGMNEDPEVSKEIQREQLKQAGDRRQEERMRELMNSQYKTDTATIRAEQ